jgi:3-hydroxyisobutyrate dehydrogenase/2-hydroxy-3-oxopropionate reductase
MTSGKRQVVAVIGLGAMGSRIAVRLLETGYEVVLWNRNIKKAQSAVALGGSLASTPAQAASSADIVITMLADRRALQEVTEGHCGIVAGLRPTAAVVEMSTVDQSSISRLQSILPTGIGLLDAPVLGSLSEAESGELKIFVSGSTSLVAMHRQLLSQLGKVIYVGDVGAGSAAKLAANNVLFGILGLLGESYALARGLGLSRESTFAVLAETPLEGQIRRRQSAIESGFYTKRFALRLARKDASLIAESAANMRMRLPLAAAARSWLEEAERAGQGDFDYSSVLAQIIANWD